MVFSHSEHAKQGDVVIVTYVNVEVAQCDEALRKGAQAVFVKNWVKEKHYVGNPAVIGVDNPTKLSTAFLSYVIDLFPAKRVAITGSLGKTTTTDMLKLTIGDAYCLYSHHSMTNSRDGVLRTAQRLQAKHEVYLQEIGAAGPGFVESTAIGFRPHACVITNIANPHLDEYKTKENILYDKLSLERHLSKQGVLFLDIDDALLCNANATHTIVSYALENPDADYRAINIRTIDNVKHFDIVCKDGRIPTKLNVLGDHNVRNALAAFAVGRWLNIPAENIVASLAKYKPQGIRQNLLNLGGDLILLDSFNADATSILGSIKALGETTLPEDGKRIAIIGDIDRLGEHSQKIHWDLGEEIFQVKQHFDVLFCFGEDIKYTYKNAKAHGVEPIFYTSNREELNYWVQSNVTRKDITLYKSGQLLAALARTVDAVYGTDYQLNAQRMEIVSFTSGNHKFKLSWEYLECVGIIESVEEIILPEQIEGHSLRKIGANAFSKHRKLVSIQIPDSVVNIGYAAFYICPSLRDIRFPANLIMLERSAFNYCTALESVILPSKTRHLSERVFCDCKKLERIFIPPSVGFIGEDAFLNCSHALTIYGESDSYAEEYAHRKGIPFKPEQF